MTEFVCKVGTPEGEILEERHAARDERAVRTELEGRGYHVFEVREPGVMGRLRFRLGRRRQRVGEQTLLLFNQELVALLRSGLPLVQALDVLLERQREPLFRDLLSEVRDRVKTGEDLSDAFARFPDALPGLYAPTLRAGERSGELEQVVQRFVRYQTLLSEARRKVASALVYPAVLVMLSLSLIAVMTLYVVPKFTEFFSALDTELPLITRVTLGVSGFLSKNWLPILLGLAGAWFVFDRWRRTTTGRIALDRIKLGSPVLGPIFERLAFSEFCRSLSTLLAGGIPVMSALESSVGAVGNAFIRQQLEPLSARVREGEALHAALSDTGIVPEITIDMVKVGESTGALDDMLSNASDFLDQEADTKMQRILILLEPVMLVFMGTVVALLLVAVYLPLFSLLGQVRQ